MDPNSASPTVVKEFQFYPESFITLLVFQDDTTAEFKGKENFDAAFRAAHHTAKGEDFDFTLTNDAGTREFTAAGGAPHETFEA